MSDKLTVWTAAKEVSTAVGTMVDTYKTLRTVKAGIDYLERKDSGFPDDCKGKGNGRSSTSEY